MALVGSSLQVNPYTALYTSLVPDTEITVSSSTAQGRTETVLDFQTSTSGDGINTRDFETLFSWPISQGTVLFTWQPTVVPRPEDSFNRATDWIECGGANGFVQGVIIEADSSNVKKQFQLQDSDTLGIHALNECPIAVGGGVAFNNQTVKAFSCVTPFIAHSVRVVTADGIAWRVWRTELIFQPFPEATMLWQTELTSLDGIGFQHIRLINLEYISTAPITLSFATDIGSGSIVPATKTIPSSSGSQAKTLLQMSPNKWKILGFSASSTAPMNLFLEGMECWVRSWGSSGEYRKIKPFAGSSASGAVV